MWLSVSAVRFSTSSLSARTSVSIEGPGRHPHRSPDSLRPPSPEVNDREGYRSQRRRTPDPRLSTLKVQYSKRRVMKKSVSPDSHHSVRLPGRSSTSVLYTRCGVVPPGARLQDTGHGMHGFSPPHSFLSVFWVSWTPVRTGMVTRGPLLPGPGVRVSLVS